jgi:hypothetical protein
MGKVLVWATTGPGGLCSMKSKWAAWREENGPAGENEPHGGRK